MKKKIFFLFLILVFSKQGFSEILLNLKEYAEVNTESIYLKDIAEIFASEKIKNELKNLEIAKSKPPNNYCILNWQFIREKISKNLKDINFTGARNIRVKTRARIITQEELLKIILEKFQDTEDLKIEFLNKPKELVLRDAPFNIIPKFESLKKGFNSLQLEIEQEGKIVKTIRINLRVRVFKEVFVTGRDIKKGEKLEGNIFKEKREITYISDVVESEEEIKNKVVSHFLKKGKIICKKDLEEHPAVYKNSLVEIILREGDISISTSGIALNSGKIGEKIQVFNPLNKKKFLGEVVDNNKVEIIN